MCAIIIKQKKDYHWHLYNYYKVYQIDLLYLKIDVY